MAGAVEEILGERIQRGVVVTKYGHVQPMKTIRLHEAGHPVPDEAGIAGAQAILDCVKGLGPEDLVLVLISGGGSALTPAPVEGISLAEKAGPHQGAPRLRGGHPRDEHVAQAHLPHQGRPARPRGTAGPGPHADPLGHRGGSAGCHRLRPNGPRSHDLCGRARHSGQVPHSPGDPRRNSDPSRSRGSRQGLRDAQADRPALRAGEKA